MIDFNFWNNTVSDDVNEYRKFYETEGYKYDEPERLSDPKLEADAIQAKAQAEQSGKPWAAKALDFLITYGDKALTVLSKNGIIKNQNLVQAGYTYTPVSTDTYNVPTTTKKGFNLDFSDPKVLVIIFLVVAILAYFLFFNRQPEKRVRYGR